MTLEEWFREVTPMRCGGARPVSVAHRKRTNSAKDQHFEHLRDCFEQPITAGLGPLPPDLSEVLTDLALGSPAVLTLRSLRRMFPQQSDPEVMVGAFDVADEFINLLNKPESIAAVRLGTERKRYWQMVARYCADACLQWFLLSTFTC